MYFGRSLRNNLVAVNLVAKNVMLIYKKLLFSASAPLLLTKSLFYIILIARDG